MRKSELTQHIAAKHLNIPQQRITDYVNAIITIMSKALIQQQRIEIRGLGSFTLRQYPSRNLYNPITGKHKILAPRRYPYFRASKTLLKSTAQECKSISQ